MENGLPPPLPKRIGGAQIRHQVARRKHLTDIARIKPFAIVLEHPRPVLDTARSQREYPR